MRYWEAVKAMVVDGAKIKIPYDIAKKDCVWVEYKDGKFNDNRGYRWSCLNDYMKECDNKLVSRDDFKYYSPLDKGERRYLHSFIIPFRNKVKSVQKCKSCFDDNDEYLKIVTSNGGYFEFPEFKKGTMYSGLEPYKEYSVKELGI